MKRLCTPLRLILAAAVLALVVSPDMGHARLSKMLADSGIEPASFEMMGETAKELYTAPSKSVGNKKSWQNASTGTSGTVEIVEIQDNCVKLFHRVIVAKTSKTNEVSTWRCKLADGTWQLSTRD